MPAISQRLAASGSALVAGVLMLAACSSSGGSATVSQSQIEAKLKKDSQVQSLLGQLPSSAKSKSDAVVSCIAKALKKDANGDTLDNYVKGKGSLNDIKGKDSSSKDKAESDVESCVKSVLGG